MLLTYGAKNICSGSKKYGNCLRKFGTTNFFVANSLMCSDIA